MDYYFLDTQYEIDEISKVFEIHFMKNSFRLLTDPLRGSILPAADAAVEERRVGHVDEAAAVPGHNLEAGEEPAVHHRLSVPGGRHGIHINTADQARTGTF